MADKSEIISKLEKAKRFAEGDTVTSYLLFDKEEEEIGELDLKRETQKGVNRILSEGIQGIIDDLKENRLLARDFSAIHSLSDKSILQYAEEKDLPDSKNFNMFKENTNRTIKEYDVENPPDFQAIECKDSEERLYGIQNGTSVKTYEPESGVLGLINKGNNYTKFEGKILIIPDRLNAIWFDDEMFIRTPKSFERLFEMRDHYEKEAEEAIDKFDDKKIEFTGDTEDWLKKEIRILRKMYSVKNNDIPEHANPDVLKEVIDTYPIENVEYDIYEEDGEKKMELEIDKYQYIWELLRLLNADYAEAEIIPDAQLEIEGNKNIIK